MNHDHYNIIGRGNLGQIVANQLLNANKNVITTSKTSQFTGSHFQYNLGDSLPNQVNGSGKSTLITLPPSSSDDLNKWKYLAQQLKSFSHVIYTSSIGALKPEKGHLRKIEDVMLANDIKIIRLGGIIFEGRHPINFLQKRSLKYSLDPINLIHSTDIAKILLMIMDDTTILDKDIHHLVSPYHPSKKEYYTKIAQEQGLEKPIFINEKSGSKEIVTDLKMKESFQFKSLYKLD